MLSLAAPIFLTLLLLSILAFLFTQWWGKNQSQLKNRNFLLLLRLASLVCLSLALAGVHRLAQLEWLRGDAVLLKFLRLPRWPVRKVFAKALAGVTDRGGGWFAL